MWCSNQGKETVQVLAARVDLVTRSFSFFVAFLGSGFHSLVLPASCVSFCKVVFWFCSSSRPIRLSALFSIFLFFALCIASSISLNTPDYRIKYKANPLLHLPVVLDNTPESTPSRALRSTRAALTYICRAAIFDPVGAMSVVFQYSAIPVPSVSPSRQFLLSQKPQSLCVARVVMR